tara:strand:- start:13118 stop:13819 length:702 start_codon:yes stop_codon:yes gene_type:complete
MKKRGGTHVGVVLSFVIFVVFLVFLYSILVEPTINKNDKDYLLENLRIKLIENVSEELITSTLNIETAPQNCIKLSNLINDLEINSKIIVKNRLKNNQISYVLGNDLEISRDNNSETFFKIYYSEEFNEVSTIGETPCNSRNYEKGLVRTNKYVFETKIINLMNEYKNNYEALKEELKIPIGSDFNFGFTYNNKTSIITEKNISTNIYAMEIPIQYVDKESNILLGSINLKIW